MLAGVALALVFFGQFGTDWLTIGAAVGVSLLLGRAMRLGGRVVEVPSTVLLVAGSGSTYGAARFWDTLIGTAAGALVCLLIPPSHLDRAAGRVATASDLLAASAEAVARGTTEQWDARKARAWLADTHRAAAALEHARTAVTEASEGARIHPQRVRRAERARQLEEWLLCLDHVCDQLQAIARGLFDLASASRGLPGPDDAGQRPELVSFAAVAEQVAHCLRLFSAACSPQPADADHSAELRERLAAAETLASQARDTLVGRQQTSAPVWALHGSLLDEASRILAELHPDHGPHRDAVRVSSPEVAKPDARAAERPTRGL